MLSLILLVYLGIRVGAGAWYFWVCGLLGFARLLKFGWGLYKAGLENR